MFVVAAAMPIGTAPLVIPHQTGWSAFSQFAHCMQENIAVTVHRFDEYGSAQILSYHPKDQLVTFSNLVKGAGKYNWAYCTERANRRGRTVTLIVAPILRD